MQLETVYENGRFEFARQVRLKYARVRLTVEIPGDEILQGDVPAPAQAHPTQPPTSPSTRSASDQIAAILALWRHQITCSNRSTRTPDANWQQKNGKSAIVQITDKPPTLEPHHAS